jgi:putative phosphoribosyl transferase
MAGSVETTVNRRFRDRSEAGRVLAPDLRGYAGRDDVVVLALPRGGVPVGYEIAKTLDAPLDVFVARKLGVPGYPELAMGAIASGGAVILDQELVQALGIGEEAIRQVVAQEARELQRREVAYRDSRPPPDLKGKTVILVDDGLATGATMRAAALAVRRHEPAQVVVAVPVAAGKTCDEFRKDVDDVVCAQTPEPFYAVGMWYEDFSQTSDEEVRELLARAAGEEESAVDGGETTRVTIPVGDVSLEGDLVLPEGARGVVVFAHGSGSGRRSPRNRRVASALNEAGVGTLLVDLLTEREEEVDAATGHLRFDIELLARRLIGIIDWRRENQDRGLSIGLFGASTGAAAALVAAAARPDEVAAVVSRGGRPDLALGALPLVRAPTLLIVGGADQPVIEWNREALEVLPGEKRLEIVPGATHLFEEPGALDEVARLAAEWFARHLGREAPDAGGR